MNKNEPKTETGSSPGDDVLNRILAIEQAVAEITAIIRDILGNLTTQDRRFANIKRP